MSNGEKRRGAFMYHDGSMLTVVDFNMQTKERRKERGSLVALLVLTIEFRREEGERDCICAMEWQPLQDSLSLQKSLIPKRSRSLATSLRQYSGSKCICVCVVS